MGEISGLRNNNLFKLQGVVFGCGENAWMIKFVGCVRCEDGRNFIEVADSFDLALRVMGLTCFKFSGVDASLEFELSDGTGIGGGRAIFWYGADGEAKCVAF